MNNNRYNLQAKTSRRDGGFTLIEMLTVVGIILILSSIIVPSVLSAKRQAKIGQTRAAIHTLDVACQMYMNDMKEIPTITPPVSWYPLSTPSPDPGQPGAIKDDRDTANIVEVKMQGRHLLVECLTGYLNKVGDGADGKGFRITGGKKLYGPYGGAEGVATVIDSANNMPVFVDSFGNQILYYCGPTFTPADNTGGTSFPGNASYVTNAAGNNFQNTFWIVSPGPDGAFATKAAGSDDITNFNR